MELDQIPINLNMIGKKAHSINLFKWKQVFIQQLEYLYKIIATPSRSCSLAVVRAGVCVGEPSRGPAKEVPVVQQFLLLMLHQPLLGLIEAVKSEQ